ncbi:SpoIIE family protein phosphatase [Streptomyces sp. MAR4 CNX-425]|uniref:SpoIIE family protein phosphatase n=1 Tax=Streptomyces sp. MAR4 CNX-425 TaxID=3406343 RepID=UPI003B50A2D7
MVTDREGRVAYWSSRAGETTGTPRAHAVGHRLEHVLGGTPPLRARLAAAIDLARRTGRRTGPVVLEGAGARHLAVEFHPLRPSGEVAAVLSESVAPSGRGPQWEYLRAVLDRSPVPMAAFDPDLRYMLVNRALQTLNNLPEEMHLGKTITELLYAAGFSADQATQVQATALGVLRTGEGVRDEVFVPKPGVDDPRRWRTSWYRLEGTDGGVLGVAVEVTEVTEHERVTAEAQTSREHLALLAEAGSQTGSSLDMALTCRQLAELLVPRLADHVAVDLLTSILHPERPWSFREDTSADLQRVTLRTHGPGEATLRAGVAAVGEVFRLPPGSLIHRCLTRNEPIPLTDFPSHPQDGEAHGRAAQEAMRASGIQSMVLVPLHARSTPLGILTLARHRNRAVFEDGEIPLLRELASRLAVSIDNAHLYEREREAAHVLQRRLLPERTEQHPGTEIAHRYLPNSASPTIAGGDWLDTVPLPGVRVALVTGDVMGKGMGSMALMGQLRTTLRSLLTAGLPPDEALHHLDRLVAQAGPFQLATCLIVVYDPATGDCRATAAGHPPPLVRSPQGDTYYAGVPPGAPLGVGDVPFETVDVPAPSGSLLALYTDGLVENADADLTRGMALLRRALTRNDRDAEGICDRLLDELVTEPRTDDMALLVARVRTLPPDAVASWELDLSPTAPRTARSLVRRQLATWGLDDLVETTELLASEVVTNAVRYGAPPVVLRLLRLGNLRCEVSDRGRMLPHLQLADPGDEGGRGIHIVSLLSRAWGTDRTDRGKTIWWEQDITPTGATW